MKYTDYLASPHWSALKIRKSRVSKLCFICKQKPDVRNFHHVRYKNLFDVKLKDLRLACEDCHRFYHAVKDEHPRWKEEWILNRVKQLVKGMRSVPD